jgi:hypothetical protein
MDLTNPEFLERIFAIPNLISFGFNSPRLASIFRGKFKNGWVSSNKKFSSDGCLVGLPRGSSLNESLI